MLRTVVLTALALVALVSNAEARQRHRQLAHDPACNITMPCDFSYGSPSALKEATRIARGRYVARQVGIGAARESARVSTHGQVVQHPANCPRVAFCGCGAAVRVFGHSVRELWLAANWFKFPRSNPSPGMVAVRRHHVMVLEADLGGGNWQVYDANSGHHLTRIHTRSLAGYVVVNPHGAG